MSHYKIKLDNFEGPLDLLLFFIRKDELDIYAIPISYITKQYLDYIALMKVLDLDIASEFILMAATLMRIKVKSMLPKTVDDEEDGEGDITSAEELTRRLIEYRQFKDSAEEFKDLADHWDGIYKRGYYHFEMTAEEVEHPKYDVSLFDLLAAFKQVLDNIDPSSAPTIKRPEVTLEKQTRFLLDYLDKKEQFLFFDLFTGGVDRSYVIVTFLAILELIKNQTIHASQSDPFGELWIHKRGAQELTTTQGPEQDVPYGT